MKWCAWCNQAIGWKPSRSPDEYVPAEEVTFRANIRTGEGEGQIAERDFRNARFVPGKLTVLNAERFIFTWEGCGNVEFRRDD